MQKVKHDFEANRNNLMSECELKNNYLFKSALLKRKCELKNDCFYIISFHFRNLTTHFQLPGGITFSWFILVSAWVELKAASGIVVSLTL